MSVKLGQTGEMYASQQTYSDSLQKMIRMPDQEVFSGGEYKLDPKEDFNGAKGSVAYYIRGALTGNPGRPPRNAEEVQLQNAWRVKIDALNPEKSDTIKLPQWVAPEAKQEFVSEVAEKTTSAPAPKITEPLANIQRLLNVAGTEVGNRAIKKNLEKASREMKVYWSNNQVTDEVLKKSMSMFSPSDIKDYVLGIPGQTQRLQANAELQRELQEDSQAFQRELLSVENQKWMMSFLASRTDAADQKAMAQAAFDHAKSIDWANLSVREQQLELSKLQATYEHVYNTAFAQWKARVDAEGLAAGGAEGAAGMDLDYFKALTTLLSKRDDKGNSILPSELEQEIEDQLGSMMGMPPEAVRSKPFRTWFKSKMPWNRAPATPSTGETKSTGTPYKTPVQPIDLGRIYAESER